MGKLYSCDRCKQIVLERHIIEEEPNKDKIDLCGVCYNEFEAWMKEKE